MTENDTLQSPRIAALRQELEAGNSVALDAFWQEVAEKGAPLFEQVEGDEQQVLARSRGNQNRLANMNGWRGNMSLRQSCPYIFTSMLGCEK